MSRVPREQEFLKNSFTAEAASAARFRAYATRAERDRLPNLAQHWLELAAIKDRLAIRQLEAAGQVHGEKADLECALAEERYENEVLYPKLAAASTGETAEVFRRLIAEQTEHEERMEALRQALTGVERDVPPKSDATLRREAQR